jgi:hypothetical protein
MIPEGRGQRLANSILYFNMRRWGNGLCSDLVEEIPRIVLGAIVETLRSVVSVTLQRIAEALGWTTKLQKIE